ncbi:gag-pol polyprotein [Cucumis melo var. makuwa]|uniref:Gag-pol polyprotein n=1 Tax=Cucumis melo var. makuwa TaxID=1194695 RepID=A0A5A7T776_CUCMM|nr:gag-pol polyprotein [Cucumis melo var. makuwa]TYK24110.1 gag-pol polyprotein [Cucumis melo var. makuwa]
MEIIRKGPSISRPPVLDAKNYSYWKPRMISFLKTLDGRAWRAVVAGWELPMIILFLNLKLTGLMLRTSLCGNSRAINVVFNGVHFNVFKLINSCSSAKEAWKIFEVAYKGTTKVKIWRSQLVTSKFEALKMSEDESVAEYNERVMEIVN